MTVKQSVVLPVFYLQRTMVWTRSNSSQISGKNQLVMARCSYLFLITLIFTSLKISSADSKISDVVYNRSKESAVRDPSVFLAIIARNAAHLLPNWLAYIENLDYPKNRMSVWWVFFFLCCFMSETRTALNHIHE